MPRPVDRRGRLVDAQEYEELAEQERQARIDRFTRGAGDAVGPRSREVLPLGARESDWEPPSTRSHDPHTLEASRARLVEHMNSRS